MGHILGVEDGQGPLLYRGLIGQAMRWISATGRLFKVRALIVALVLGLGLLLLALL
jgi:hypothetical protein